MLLLRFLQDDNFTTEALDSYDDSVKDVIIKDLETIKAKLPEVEQELKMRAVDMQKVNRDWNDTLGEEDFKTTRRHLHFIGHMVGNTNTMRV